MLRKFTAAARFCVPSDACVCLLSTYVDGTYITHSSDRAFVEGSLQLCWCGSTLSMIKQIHGSLGSCTMKINNTMCVSQICTSRHWWHAQPL